jgi:predicted ATPase/transcriptional regulator with XRE-family HTH domain
MAHSSNTSFGELLRHYRKSAGLTQEELAQAARLSVRAISDLERGVNQVPRRDTLMLLLHALKLSEADRDTFEVAARRQALERGRISTSSAQSGLSGAGEAVIAPPHRNNLPTFRTSFVGRSREMAEIRSLLRQGSVRMVTLAGSAGVGKTRLALQATGALLDHFNDGAFLADLSRIADPSLVLHAVTNALGLTGPDTEEEVDLRLHRYLESKHLLLILDNFEHILPAAHQLVDLVDAHPALTLLVTSRVPLQIAVEHVYEVPPLALPDAAEVYSGNALATVLENEAVTLFADRAQAVRYDFTISRENAWAVCDICARLDGLPLAIELAAARIKILSPQEMVPLLDNRLRLLTQGADYLSSRHQTLRAALGWSYQLLSAREQYLFRRLSVFVGGCTLEAASVLYCEDDDHNSVAEIEGRFDIGLVDSLTSLVNSSLIARFEDEGGVSRFTMLDTMREFGIEKLEENDELEAVRGQHAAFFMRLAERADPELRTSEQLKWFKALDADYANILAALMWLAERDTRVAIGMAVTLCWYWEMRYRWGEGRAWLTQLLGRVDQRNPTFHLAMSHTYIGQFATYQGDYEVARLELRRGMELWRKLGDNGGLADALNNLASLALREGQYEAARIAATESVALSTEAGDQWRLGRAMFSLGSALRYLSQWESAEAHVKRCETLARDAGDRWLLGWTLYSLGYYALRREDYAAARTYFEEGHALQQALGKEEDANACMRKLGEVELLTGNHDEAETILVDSLLRDLKNMGDALYAAYITGILSLPPEDAPRALNMQESLSSRLNSRPTASQLKDYSLQFSATNARILYNLGLVAYHKGDYSKARALQEESLHLNSAVKSLEGIVPCLGEIACLAVVGGLTVEAAILFGAVYRACEQLASFKLPQSTRKRYEHACEMARARLGDTAWQAAWEEGRTMALEDVVAYALGQQQDAGNK